MKNMLESIKDLDTYINELKTFNWFFENGSIEACRYGYKTINSFVIASNYSPAHKEVWAEYEKKYLTGLGVV